LVALFVEIQIYLNLAQIKDEHNQLLDNGDSLWSAVVWNRAPMTPSLEETC
jgi:hypothetical protein